MKQVIFFSAIILSVSLSSCNNKVKEERGKRIDSLGIHLNHVEDVLKTVDTIALTNWNSQIGQVESWLWDNVEDTLDLKSGIVIGDFLRTKKYIGKVESRYRDVKKETKYASKQLASLREDVKNNFYSEEEFKGYFGTESAAIDELVKAGDQLEVANGSLVERYKLIYPEATQIIDSIKTVIYGDKPRAK
jgi:hypothetical protein